MQTFPERIADLSEVIARDMKSCMKRPTPIKATQMYGEFRVQTMEGDYKQGKPGDYLMCGIDGELYICDQSIFERSYDWVEHRYKANSGPGLGDDVACEKCGLIALDTGLERYECGHDNWLAVTGRQWQASTTSEPGG